MHYQPPIMIHPTSGAAHSAIIWLHGLGADGNDFVPIAHALKVQEKLGLRFVFPHAPVQSVTLNNGHPMPAWYDLYSAEMDQSIDHAGIAKSVAYLNQLVTGQLNTGIRLDKIILAGFSQGGVVALDCALRMAQKPAGVMVLSAYLAESVGTGAGLKVFHAHGIHDEVIPISLAELTYHQLHQLGAEMESHRYPMAHAVHPQEIRDIADWLNRCLGTETSNVATTF